MAEKKEREKALQNAITSIEKDFGKGSIMRLGENRSMEVETIPTGAISLDLALGVVELLRFMARSRPEKQQ